MKKILPALMILVVLIAALSGCINPIVNLNPLEAIVSEFIASVSTENLDRLMAIYDDPINYNGTNYSWNQLKSDYASAFADAEIHSATIVSKTTNIIDGTINFDYDLDLTELGTRETRRLNIFMRAHLVGLNWKVYLENESLVTP